MYMHNYIKKPCLPVYIGSDVRVIRQQERNFIESKLLYK